MIVARHEVPGEASLEKTVAFVEQPGSSLPLALDCEAQTELRPPTPHELRLTTATHPLFPPCPPCPPCDLSPIAAFSLNASKRSQFAEHGRNQFRNGWVNVHGPLRHRVRRLGIH
jgi:hypothetical protein